MESFELPKIKEDEILIKVETNGICMSSYKAAIQGASHKRVPGDIAENPVILGHEMCATIVEVGDKHKGKYKEGSKCTIQPALGIPKRDVGYSFPYLGGNATYGIVAKEVIERNCLIPFEGDSYFNVALAEPIACILSALKEQFHYTGDGFEHEMGIKEGGNLIILGGAGPMGLATVDFILNSERKPKLLVVTDIDETRLNRAGELFPKEKTAASGVEVLFVNTQKVSDEELLKETDNKGFDDVFIFVPIKPLTKQASKLMAIGGCMNFFAGPSDSNFSAEINFYDVHYNKHHIIGSAGSSSQDLKDAIELIANNKINPEIMVTHIGGLDCTPETVLNQPKIPGGKKLIYTQISLPLTAIDDFEELGKTDALFGNLAEIVKKTNGIWSKEAEDYLLANAKTIEELSI